MLQRKCIIITPLSGEDGVYVLLPDRDTRKEFYKHINSKSISKLKYCKEK